MAGNLKPHSNLIGKHQQWDYFGFWNENANREQLSIFCIVEFGLFFDGQYGDVTDYPFVNQYID